MTQFKLFSDDMIDVTVHGFSNGKKFHEASLVKKTELWKLIKTIHPDHDWTAHDNNHNLVDRGIGPKIERRTGEKK